MLKGGLPLREWVSNYLSALNQLSEEEISSSNPVKVLGYSYDADWDSLQLKHLTYVSTPLLVPNVSMNGGCYLLVPVTLSAIVHDRLRL